MSLMNAIAVSVLLFSNLKIFIPYKWILIVSSALLTVSSVLMASKSGILSLLAVYLIYVYKTFSVKNKPVTIMIMSAIICASAFLIWVSPAQDRIKQSLQVILQPGSAINQQEGTAGRLLAWKTAWHISKDYFPLGTGTGDIKKVTLNHYEKTGYHWPLYYKLNAHNQFLQSLAAIGIGGLLSLVLMIFIPLMRSKKDIELPMVFILLVFFNLLFECMFEVQNGVMLIAACYALWIVRPAPSLKNV
jgi:O-antigen ligase